MCRFQKVQRSIESVCLLTFILQRIANNNTSVNSAGRCMPPTNAEKRGWTGHNYIRVFIFFLAH